MDLQNALILAIGSVTTALVFVCKLLWSRSQIAEADNSTMRIQLNKLEGSLGRAEGRLLAYENCSSNACPFRRPVAATQPIHAQQQ